MQVSIPPVGTMQLSAPHVLQEAIMLAEHEPGRVHASFVHPPGHTWEIQIPLVQVCKSMPEHCFFPDVHTGATVGHTHDVPEHVGTPLFVHVGLVASVQVTAPLGAVPNVQHPWLNVPLYVNTHPYESLILISLGPVQNCAETGVLLNTGVGVGVDVGLGVSVGVAVPHLSTLLAESR